MSKLDEFPLSTSAYIADTQHLNLEQHGAYLLILMALWRCGGEIKNDDKLIANICKITVSRWKKIGAPIRDLLLVVGDKISQKRVRIDVEKVKKIVAKNIENGRAGGIAKSLKVNGQHVATATVSPDVRQTGATGLSDSALTYSPSPKDSEIRKRKKVRADSKSKGVVLPKDWRPKPKHYERGIELGFDRQTVDLFADRMRNWSEANGHRAVARKSDWDAAFMNWLTDKAERNGGSNGAGKKGDGKDRSVSAAAGRLLDAGFSFGPRPGGTVPATSPDIVGVLPEGGGRRP